MIEAIAKLHAELLKLLLQQEQSLIVLFFLENGARPAEKKPPEKNPTGNRCYQENERV
jgi:hypothetical protein